MDIMDLLQEELLIWSKWRLKTFEHWPFHAPDSTCNPERMAAAGFIAVGGKIEPDLAECFMCGKQLDGWDPDDDPWQEHVKHMPACTFVKLNKQDEKLWTVAELYSILKEYLLKKCTRAAEDAVNKVKEDCDTIYKTIPKIYQGIKRQRKSNK